MALSPLQKYIYMHGSDEVIRRGKKIYSQNGIELLEYDDLFGAATFRIKDDTYTTFYRIQVQKIKEPKNLSLRCTCPYNQGEVCRHEIAALFYLQDMQDKGMLKSHTIYDQRLTVARMKTIDLKMIRMFSSADMVHEAEAYLQQHSITIYSADNEMVRAGVMLNDKEFQVLIGKNEERNFATQSDYVDTHHVLCLPKVIVFVFLLNKYGPNYFDTIRNWDKEKNKLLELYGYSLKDNLKGKFEFTYKDGKPFLRVLDTSIKRVAPLAAPTRLVVPVEPVVDIQPVEIAPVVEEETDVQSRMALVFNFNKNTFPFFSIDVVSGELQHNKNVIVGVVEKLDINRYVDLDTLPPKDRYVLQVARKFQDVEINKYLARNSPFAGIWDNITTSSNDVFTQDTRELVIEYLFPRLKKLAGDVNQDMAVYFLPKGKAFKTANLQALRIDIESAMPAFYVKKTEDYNIQCRVKTGSMVFSLEDNETESSLFFLYNHQMFFWNSIETVQLIDAFMPTGNIVVDEQSWRDKLNSFLLPISKQYKVEFDAQLVRVIKDELPEIRVFLEEKGDYLIFQPSFLYKGFEAKDSARDEMIIPHDSKILLVNRNREAEQRFFETFQNLHSHFVYNDDQHSFALKGIEVLKNNWFFLFVDAMKEMKIPVYGFEALHNFRFNTAKPETHIYISSNTDWFDAKVDIIFNGQKVSVADVKKALANRQQYVQLSDGTLGILPEEWLKKYSLLFRVGEGQSNTLKLSRYHLSVIDELYENRNEAELFLQLEEKYSNLRQFDKITEVSPPAHLEKTLRPYQLAGLNWLNYLKDVSWGGILADDMGLGKTLQALTFLEHYKNEMGSLKSMVVCPTTLIYNWENEIKKFTPGLTYKIHHSAVRARKIAEFNNVDVIITTYGTLRSDIKLLVGIELDYVILDESQAIKNPASKVTKAAGLLKAKNRLCMSGTPLQNNTFDIYAQMNFLNPGMLGTVEFFKQEFAIPIDKLGEKDRKDHLRKILYPFLLRRTKEQVARDLPEKQEMILWCEMEDEQRRIYDAYRNEFRDKILGNIEQVGIQRSQLTILQGLMKLRQICDSPAILNEDEVFENHSIKLEELAREIIENIGDHKALVFSQFLGMLALIKEKLNTLGVKYQYFDGSTSAPDREKAIQSFQNDDEVRVFLISLKAGGVGLNLTAADYVYIVDPWWNPAVEQQAIDRTHRIGQTKHIFAYRMICKDTIEDKILQLQEKKRSLAKELIADDDGFVKSLTREDVEYLFS